MRKWREAAWAVVLCLLPIVLPAVETPWRTNYERGLKLVAQGNYQTAIGYLEMAVADKPLSEIIRAETPPVEYLPYLQLGICYFHLNKVELAAEYLELEAKLSAIASSHHGKQLWENYRSKLADLPAAVDDSSHKKIRQYTKKKYLLSETEAERLKKEIRRRCRLPEAEDKAYPWYYHYELGLAYQKKEDWQRALDSFLAALDHKGQPGKLLRIYGVWFIDYFPYYQIGKAHYYLQNWECAREAFLLSEAFEDIRPSDPEHSKLKDYVSRLKQNPPSNE